MTLALIYLARGEDNNLMSIKKFFETYKLYPPGYKHDLIVIFKGWKKSKGLKEVVALAQTHKARIIDLPDDGFDWGAYMRVTSLLEHEWLFFMNTPSSLRVNNWLNYFTQAIPVYGENLGAVGATASYESMVPSQKTYFLQNFPHEILNPVKHIILNHCFPSFPNPHLRSNAFMVRRKTFIDFTNQNRIPLIKLNAWMLESGKNGFTKFLLEQGLKPILVGANGKYYEQKDWPQSGIFRTPGQPNLLIADNQTTAYDLSQKNDKERLEKNTWGKTFNV